MNKQKAIEIIKKIISENSTINLNLGEKGSAMWKKDSLLLNPLNWKHIGYVSALSEAFNINIEDLKEN